MAQGVHMRFHVYFNYAHMYIIMASARKSGRLGPERWSQMIAESR